MQFISRFRALLGVAIPPLLIATLVSIGITGHSPSTSAAGDCTADPSLDSEELVFLSLINNHRAQNGLGPLAPSYTLSKAGQWKSNDLGVNAYFAHDDLFRTWVERLRDCGHTANAWLGENIAGGTQSAQAAFDIFKNSPGHNANMLGTAYTGIGIGRAYVAGSPFGWYWTTEFTSINDPFPSGATPTSTPTLTPTKTPTKTATPTPAAAQPTATPAPQSGVTAHVVDLDRSTKGSVSSWTPRVSVWVRTNTNAPVIGAIVNGTFSDGKSGSCVTKISGGCVIQGAKQVGAGSVTFTTTYVAKADVTYNPSANTDPDGDSDGTVITIVK